MVNYVLHGAISLWSLLLNDLVSVTLWNVLARIWTVLVQLHSQIPMGTNTSHVVS